MQGSGSNNMIDGDSHNINDMSTAYFEVLYCPECHEWRKILVPFGPDTNFRVCAKCGSSWRSNYLPTGIKNTLPTG